MTLFGLKLKRKYVIEGVEQVYDAFDNFERTNPMDQITLKAFSLADALHEGRVILQEKIDKYRREGGYMSTGMFIAEVSRILNKKGKVLYERK